MKHEKIRKISKISKVNSKNLTKMNINVRYSSSLMELNCMNTGLGSIFHRPANPLAKLKSFHVITSLVTYSHYIQTLASVLTILSWQRVPNSAASRPKMIAVKKCAPKK